MEQNTKFVVSENLDNFKIFVENSLKAKDVDPAIDYLNYIVDRMEMNDEQILWLCFLYACTYHLPSAYVIWNEFPDLELVDIPRLEKFMEEKQKLIPFQIDKMRERRFFHNTVRTYQELVNGSQKEYFDNVLNDPDPDVNFQRLYTPAFNISHFARFSIWNWCQALKHVYGYNIESKTILLGDRKSISFGDGLGKAFGREYLISVKKDGKREYHHWTDDEKADMEELCKSFKKEMNIDYFQLETLACAFKKLFRTYNSRYVGYYHDRLADDIHAVECWKGVDWNLLWECREEIVPPEYIHNNGVDTKKFKLPLEMKIRT